MDTTVTNVAVFDGEAPLTGRYDVSFNDAEITAVEPEGSVPLTGTLVDANDAPGVPAAVPHGSSLHDELGLLVEAGLSPVEALRAATGAAAEAFGLADRGRIRRGLRADLLLVTGDPAADIAATRAVAHVWRAS